MLCGDYVAWKLNSIFGHTFDDVQSTSADHKPSHQPVGQETEREEVFRLLLHGDDVLQVAMLVMQIGEEVTDEVVDDVRLVALACRVEVESERLEAQPKPLRSSSADVRPRGLAVRHH